MALLRLASAVHSGPALVSTQDANEGSALVLCSAWRLGFLVGSVRKRERKHYEDKDRGTAGLLKKDKLLKQRRLLVVWGDCLVCVPVWVGCLWGVQCFNFIALGAKLLPSIPFSFLTLNK